MPGGDHLFTKAHAISAAHGISKYGRLEPSVLHDPQHPGTTPFATSLLYHDSLPTYLHNWLVSWSDQSA